MVTSQLKTLQLLRERCRGSFLVILLALLFIASFALPLAFALRVGGIGSESVAPKLDNVVANGVSVYGKNTYIEVAHSDHLNPQTGRDFLLVSWVRFRKLPQTGERVLFLGKFSPDTQVKPGYALGFARDQEELRPVVYWQDQGGQGGWFTFAELDVLPQSWIMLVLSFFDGQYLGLHAVTRSDDGSTELFLLGGYEVESELLPNSAQNLLVGSFRGGSFRGRLGPIGIFSGDELSETLTEIVEQMGSDASRVPAALDSAETLLWTGDLSEELKPEALRRLNESMGVQLIRSGRVVHKVMERRRRREAKAQ